MSPSATLGFSKVYCNRKHVSFSDSSVFKSVKLHDMSKFPTAQSEQRLVLVLALDAELLPLVPVDEELVRPRRRVIDVQRDGVVQPLVLGDVREHLGADAALAVAGVDAEILDVQLGPPVRGLLGKREHAHERSVALVHDARRVLVQVRDVLIRKAGVHEVVNFALVHSGECTDVHLVRHVHAASVRLYVNTARAAVLQINMV